jgi:glycosyltransferase involved in cell wall biosynthesis
MSRICIFPRVEGLGGVASFRLKFEQALHSRGVDVTNNLNDPADAVLILAGTRHLIRLGRARRRGQRIVQRLDGVNWVHRARWAGLRYTLRAIYGNWNLARIRRRLADRIVYQSQFVKGWWEEWYRTASAPSSVILNGVDLGRYTPHGLHERPSGHYRILIVEGYLTGALNSGLLHAAELADRVSRRYKVELCIAGGVDRRTQNKLQDRGALRIRVLDAIPRDQIPWLMRSSHLLFSAEVNPPCPNSVIEALACGLPVIGFDTGSLSEIVRDGAGKITGYGANHWKLEPPDIQSLAEAAEEVLTDNDRFRAAARKRAESAFGLERMTEEYLKVLL